MQIIKRPTLVSKLIVNLKLDGKRREGFEIESKEPDDCLDLFWGGMGVGERVQRHPSCWRHHIIRCCPKHSCLKHSFCCLQCCRYMSAQQILSNTAACNIFQCNPVHMFTKSKTESRAALEWTDCCTSACLPYANNYLCILWCIRGNGKFENFCSTLIYLLNFAHSVGSDHLKTCYCFYTVKSDQLT